MAKKIISYKLNSNGTVPDFVEDGGYLAKNSNDTPNMICMGVSKDGADVSNAEAEFINEASAFEWVSTYLSDTTFTDPVTKEEKQFNVNNAVAELFAKLA